ncbi:MAG: tetratricopeptide repeat protein [Methanobacterium sp.]
MTNKLIKNVGLILIPSCILFSSCMNNPNKTNEKFATLRERAKSYYEKDSFLLAYKAYDSLVKIDNSNPEYFFKIGRTALVLNKKEEGRAYLFKAISMNYRPAKAYYNIGVSYFFEHNTVLARKYIMECLKRDPQHIKARVVLDELNAKEGSL